MKPMRLVPVVAAAAALLAGCQVLSTTTNSVTSALNSLSDTASSTSGSSGSGNKSAFVGTRFEAIRFEAARGEGENLDSLAQLLGEPDRAAFAQWMHANYARLFTGLAGPDELLARIEEYRGYRG
jgi:Protein of unknown function (DUF3015)